MSDEDRNDMVYWFPLLAATGVAMPPTTIIRTDVNLINVLDGQKPAGFDEFIAELRAAADAFGYPVFLRTGLTSGKHDWRNTCHVPSPEALTQHVANLIEFSECVDMFGLPYQTWAIRTMLPLASEFTAFSGFPVNKERRYFIGGGEVLCHHPYWPAGAVADGNPSDPDWRPKLETMNHESSKEVELLSGLSRIVSKAFDRRWSLDWAQDIHGDWYAIDMALAERSYHWPGCPKGAA